MNAHDSERIKGMLEELGLGETSTQEDADVLVFNTCTIREKPDTKFAAHLAQAAALKQHDPDKVIAVGGCYAEAQRERLFTLYPYVDVAFGPGSIPHLGEWLGGGGLGVARGRFGLDDRSFAGELPMHRERAFQAWVQISMGCNSKCSYCIVPAVRGREVSRRPGDVLAEVARLAHEGVVELTLLGQNVNSWGRDLRPDIDTDFGELLRACDAVEGIERIRFTSPHPKDFRRPVIDAMAECESVCEHAHLPLQSGSSRILKAMRRTYDRERYLRLAGELRAAIPDLALTTDIIVGFPGETEDDFRETIEVVEEVGFDTAFTFVYSPRAGTEAADMEDQISDAIKRDRIERLVDVVQRVAATRNAERVGGVEEVLVEGHSRTDPALLRGRTRRNTTVNFAGTAAASDVLDLWLQGATSTLASRARRRRRCGAARHSSGSQPDAGPHHRLERADRHEPRATPPARGPRGLRRRQARERVDRRLSLPAAGPDVPGRAGRRLPAGRRDRPPCSPREGARARARAAPCARERDHDVQRPRVLPRQPAPAHLLVDARGVRRRPPVRGVRRIDGGLRLHGEPLFRIEDRVRGADLLVRALLRTALPRLPLLECLRPL